MERSRWFDGGLGPALRHLRGALLASSMCLVQLLGCTYFEDDKSDETRERNLLILLAAWYLSNPCNRIAPPVTNAAAATSNALTGVGSFRGRVLTTGGSAVVNAIVMAQDATSNDDADVFGTHSSLRADGSFELAGLLTSIPNYKLSVEPLNPAYAQRIDLHIDCFVAPSSFQYGWYAGNGATAATSFAGGSTLSVSPNVRTDVGTFVVRQ